MTTKRDIKSFLLASHSPVVRLLKLSPRLFTLPSLVIYLVNRCNYYCVMCPVNEQNKAALEKMDLPMVEDLLTQIAAFPIKPRIHFSGYGEPLVYSHFRDVIRLCKEKKLIWSITTNGYLLERYGEDIVAGNCRGINISIHGGPETHDRVVNVKKAFEKTIAGIQHIDQIKRAQKKENPAIAINCVINHDNVQQLKDIFQTFNTLPVNSVTFQHLIFSEPDLLEQKDFLIREPQDLQAILELRRFVENSPSKVKANFYPALSDEQIEPYYTDKNYPARNACVMPWLSTRIYPTGDVIMCDVNYGNLKNAPLKDLINSEAALTFRKKVSQQRFYTDQCFRCCHRQYT